MASMIENRSWPLRHSRWKKKKKTNGKSNEMEHHQLILSTACRETTPNTFYQRNDRHARLLITYRFLF